MCKNYNSGNRSLVSTLVVLAICLVIVTGSTFSLFTSNTGVNIAVTAGNVELTANIIKDTFKIYSMDRDLGDTEVFENGGTAKFNTTYTTLTLDKITPGDKVAFQIQLENKSNVDVKYRVTWTLVGDDAFNEALVTTVNATEIKDNTSEWTLWTPAEEKIQTIDIVVEFPTGLYDEAERYEKYRALMNKTLDIQYKVEAVQANGTYAFPAFVNTENGLQEAINSGATYITLTDNIELTENLSFGTLAQTRTITEDTETTNNGITIDLNDYSITSAEGVDAGILNVDKEVSFVNGTIAVDIQNYATTTVESVTFVDSTVTSHGDEAKFDYTDIEGTVEIEKYIDINGISYIRDEITEALTLYLVPSDYTGTTVEVAEGTTTIGGYAFAYNTTVETIILPETVTTLADRAFRDTSATTVVLNEGLTNISYQAFRNAANVKTVKIPSTVTTIGKEAFQNSGITELVIPATVTTLEYGAMRDMKNLVTVTIEGNVQIPVYAFRACTELKEVYLKGDDVTFAGRGMIFTNKENGDGSAITVYVANETVKERLLAADTASKDYGGYAIVVPKPEIVVTTTDELLDAFANAQSGDVIDATGVTYTISGADHFYIPAGITLKGLTVKAAYRGGNYVRYGNGNGSDPIILENCSFGNSDRSIVLAGVADGATYVTYNNCTFSGQVITNFVDNTAGVAEFNNCLFTNVSSAFYSFTEAMGGTHIFNSCTFNYTGLSQSSMGVLNNASINVYSETEYFTSATFNGCTFTNCGRRIYGPNSTLIVR